MKTSKSSTSELHSILGFKVASAFDVHSNLFFVPIHLNTLSIQRWSQRRRPCSTGRLWNLLLRWEWLSSTLPGIVICNLRSSPLNYVVNISLLIGRPLQSSSLSPPLVGNGQFLAKVPATFSSQDDEGNTAWTYLSLVTCESVTNWWLRKHWHTVRNFSLVWGSHFS